MTIIRRYFLREVFLLIGFCIRRSLGQDTCVGYTWVTVPGASPLNPSASSSTSQADCQSRCFSDSNCRGVSWSGSSCQRSLDSLINYSAPDASTYYSLIRSLSNCNQSSSCSYYWSGTKDFHGWGGVDYNKSSLNDCVQTCQLIEDCSAMDWDTDKNKCFLLLGPGHQTGFSSKVYHFPRNCQAFTTVPVPASTSSTTTASTPRTTATTTATTTTVRSSSSSTTLAATLPSSSTTLSASSSSSSSTASSSSSSSSTASSSRNQSASSSSSTTSSSSPSSSSSSSSKTTVIVIAGSNSTPSASNTSSSSSSAAAAPTSTSTSTTPTTTTTDPRCNGVLCGRGQTCFNFTTCVCIPVCPRALYAYSPVCGSNNKSYSNDCELNRESCFTNQTITRVRAGTCNADFYADDSVEDPSSGLPTSIKPAYIVLAGLGGGCLLLVLTAVIILCEYPLHGAETYSSNGTLVKGRSGIGGAGGAYIAGGEDINMDAAGAAGEDGSDENVEFNPYYNRSELGAPDFTKEENIM